jgi:hypothetical protein
LFKAIKAELLLAKYAFQPGVSYALIIFQPHIFLSAQRPIQFPLFLYLSQASYSPQLHAEYIELLPLVAQRFVAKREACAADSAVKTIVEP